MPGFPVKNILKLSQCRTSGKADTDSNRFPCHDGRMAAHVIRIRDHVCERPRGAKCEDCIRGQI